MTDTKSLDFISVQITEGLAKVLLNRPDRLNAASPVLVSELRSALAEVLAARVAVVVISGRDEPFAPPRPERTRTHADHQNLIATLKSQEITHASG